MLVRGVDVKYKKSAAVHVPSDTKKRFLNVRQLGQVVEAVESTEAGVDALRKLELTHILIDVQYTVAAHRFAKHILASVNTENIHSPRLQLTRQRTCAAGEVKTKTCFVIEPRTKTEQVIRAFGIARVLHEGFVKPREIAVAVHHDLPFILSRTRE